MKWIGRREHERTAFARDAMRRPIRSAGMQLIMTTLAARHAPKFGPISVDAIIDATAQLLWVSPHVRSIYETLESLRQDLDNTLMAPGGTAWRKHVTSGSTAPFEGDDLMRTAHEARKKVLFGASGYPIKGARFK